MKKTILFLLALGFACSLSLWARDDWGDGGGRGSGGDGGSDRHSFNFGNGGASHSQESSPQPAPRSRGGNARSFHAGPVIHLGGPQRTWGGQPGSGGHTWQHGGQQGLSHSWQQAPAAGQASTRAWNSQRLGMGMNVVHHHPDASPAQVRSTLRQLGIKKIPHPITERSQILDTDRRHSMIQLPHQGPGGRAITANLIPGRELSSPLVRSHMASLGVTLGSAQIAHYNQTELGVGVYYWHHADHYNFCHYYDPWGYHWYGWYIGDSCFWTRWYADRWWWYDPITLRWCFWNDGGWWWQDPYHVGDLYVYVDGRFVPCSYRNTVVTTVEPLDTKVFRSPDGSRLVKIMGDSNDAFLYDTAIPPNFNPLYLASKVESVKFSPATDQRPMQIMLTLADGTFDVFDADGQPYNFNRNNAPAYQTESVNPPSQPAPSASQEEPPKAPDVPDGGSSPAGSK